MNYIFSIKNNATGEVRQFTEEWDSETRMIYQYTNGNYGCDCNRELFFARAGGEDDPEDGDESPCGNDRFTILSAFDENGRTVEIDKP